MLILSRKVGETIVIGGQVLVQVSRVRSGSVSLGITAPAGVPVDRKEISGKETRGEDIESAVRVISVAECLSAKFTARCVAGRSISEGHGLRLGSSRKGHPCCGI